MNKLTLFLFIFGASLYLGSILGPNIIINESFTVPPESVLEYKIKPMILSTVKITVSLNSSLEDATIELLILDDAEYQEFVTSYYDLSVPPNQRDFAETRWFGLIQYQVKSYSDWHVIIDNVHRANLTEEVKQGNITITIVKPYEILKIPAYFVLIIAMILLFKNTLFQN